MELVFRSTNPLIKQDNGGQTIRAWVEGSVITEPRTLLPHRFDMVHRYQVEAAGHDPLTSTDQSIFAFAYE